MSCSHKTVFLYLKEYDGNRNDSGGNSNAKSIQLFRRSLYAAGGGSAHSRKRDAGIRPVRPVGHGDEPPQQGVPGNHRSMRGAVPPGALHPRQLQGAVPPGGRVLPVRHDSPEPDEPIRQGGFCPHRPVGHQGLSGGPEVRGVPCCGLQQG